MRSASQLSSLGCRPGSYPITDCLATCLALLQVFNGVLINVNDLPLGSGWVAQIGFIKWAFEALVRPLPTLKCGAWQR